MKKHLVGLFIIASLVAFSGLAYTAHAQQMTLSQMIELFVTLGIIPDDKAAQAQNALSGQSNAVVGTTDLAPSRACLDLSKNLTIGSSGEDVRFIQEKLNIFPATGYFGAITKNSVINFQAHYGLKTTGYLDAQTRAKFNELHGCSQTVCTADTQLCSDGSYVGRNPKNGCEFNACPSTDNPYVTLLNPNGGANYRVGEYMDIKWNSSGLKKNQKIVVSLLDDVSRYGRVIFKNTPNDGQQRWKISELTSRDLLDKNGNSLTPSGKYVLHIGCADAGCTVDDSDSHFTITKKDSNATTDIELKSVKASENPFGYVMEVCVHGPKSINDIKKENNLVDGFPFADYFTDANGVEQFRYQGAGGGVESLKNGECNEIGASIAGGTDRRNIEASGMSRLKMRAVVDPYNLIQESKENNNERLFSIAVPQGGTNLSDPTLTIISPNGGQSYKVGERVTVKWSSVNSKSNKVSIGLLSDGSVNYVPIVSAMPDTGSYTITIPQVATGEYKISIDSSDKGPLAADNSDDTINIVSSSVVPLIKIIQPNGGEGYDINGSIYIYYRSENIVGKKLTAYLYSPINGNVRSVITTAANNSMVEMQLQKGSSESLGQYKITLCANDVDSPIVQGKPLCDSSDNYFNLISSSPVQTSITVLTKLISVSENVSDDNTAATFTFKTQVSSPSKDVYISKTPKHSNWAQSGFVYVVSSNNDVDLSGDTVATITGSGSTSGDKPNHFLVPGGATRDFTITISARPSGFNGVIQATLGSLNWSVSPGDGDVKGVALNYKSNYVTLQSPISTLSITPDKSSVSSGERVTFSFYKLPTIAARWDMYVSCESGITNAECTQSGTKPYGSWNTGAGGLAQFAINPNNAGSSAKKVTVRVKAFNPSGTLIGEGSANTSVNPQVSVQPSLSATPTSGTLSGASPTLWVDFMVNNYSPTGNEIIDFGDGTKSALGYTTAYNNRHDYHTAGTYNVRLLLGNTVIATTKISVNPQVSVQPTITILSPNGGETITSGTAHKLTWKNGVAGTKISAYFVAESGGTEYWLFSDVEASLGANTINIIPSIPPGKYKFLMIDNGIGSDTSDSSFTIVAPPATQPTTVTVAYPNGGETWTQGDSKKIRWNGPSSYSNAPYTQIGVYGPNGTNDFMGSIYGGSWINGNSYLWDGKRVCSGFSNGVGSGCKDLSPGNYRILVSIGDGSIRDLSDWSFTITAPATTGADIKYFASTLVGNTAQISWSLDKPAYVTLFLMGCYTNDPVELVSTEDKKVLATCPGKSTLIEYDSKQLGNVVNLFARGASAPIEVSLALVVLDENMQLTDIRENINAYIPQEQVVSSGSSTHPNRYASSQTASVYFSWAELINLLNVLK